MSISISEDYAVLHAEAVSFYYGYEVTDDEGAWCFKAKGFAQDSIVMTQDDLQMSDQCDVVNGLLRGIEILINRKIIGMTQ